MSDEHDKQGEEPFVEEPFVEELSDEALDAVSGGNEEAAMLHPTQGG